MLNDAYLKTTRTIRQSRKHEENFSVAESGTEIPKNWLRKSVKIDLSQNDQYYKTMAETQKNFKVVKNTFFFRVPRPF